MSEMKSKRAVKNKIKKEHEPKESKDKKAQNDKKIEPKIETKIEPKIETKIEAKDAPEKPNDELKEDDPALSSFYNEIDDIKDPTFVSNSKEQIDRLLRPGATYFNLNPFDVLQIDPYASIDDIKRRYRKLSMYVHPDKNKDNLERAQLAFEAVNKAYKMLDDEKERKRCLEIVDEAREKVDFMVVDKRKKLKRDKSGEEPKIDEDDPDKYRHAVYVMTCKLFADVERLKVRESEKKVEEKKRKAVEKEEEDKKAKVQKQWDTNYEETRQTRISSWQNFKTKGHSSYKPPKNRPEQR